MTYVINDQCVDCGACEPVCPVDAIDYEDDVPAPSRTFIAINAEFFAEIGSPGGASKIGKLDRDHPAVTALPIKDHAE